MSKGSDLYKSLEGKIVPTGLLIVTTHHLIKSHAPKEAILAFTDFVDSLEVPPYSGLRLWFLIGSFNRDMSHYALLHLKSKESGRLYRALVSPLTLLEKYLEFQNSKDQFVVWLSSYRYIGELTATRVWNTLDYKARTK